jgi:HAD superfamily hydrolase (TIGR01549 family)
MIKAIIFDCFGVLTKDWWREFCDTLPQGEILEKAKALNRQYDSGLIDLQEFVTSVQRVTGREPKPIEDIFTTPVPEKNLELLEYIEELRKNYKIGLISNIGSSWITDSFLDAKEQKLFDDMVFSFQVGVSKPDPKIYQASLDNLGVGAQQAVFIDDIESYVIAAQQMGMAGIAYSGFNQMKKELETLIAPVADN